MTPPWQSTFLDSNNKVSQPWLQFFMSLYNQASGNAPGGGSSDGFALQQSIDIEGIQTNIDQVMAMALNSSSGSSAAGNDSEIQFNQNGELAGSSNFRFANEKELLLRGTKIEVSDSDPNTATPGDLNILGRDAQDDTLGDNLNLKAGSDVVSEVQGASIELKSALSFYGGSTSITSGSVNGDLFQSGVGGNVSITAGSVSGEVDPLNPDDVRTGGDVSISTGSGDTSNGEFSVSIAGVPAFKINKNLALGVGSSVNYGQPGQILTSTGSGSEPAWMNTGSDYIRFDYGDLPVREIFVSAAGKYLVSVELIIHEAFDDPAATASIGIDSFPEYLMATTENSITNTGSYTTEPGEMWAVDTPVYLNLSAGSSTQGQGIIVITYQRSLP